MPTSTSKPVKPADEYKKKYYELKAQMAETEDAKPKTIVLVAEVHDWVESENSDDEYVDALALVAISEKASEALSKLNNNISQGETIAKNIPRSRVAEMGAKPSAKLSIREAIAAQARAYVAGEFDWADEKDCEEK